MLEYRSDVLFQEDLNSHYATMAAEQWQLFSVQPFTVRGVQGVDQAHFLVTMVRVPIQPEQKRKSPMACRG